MTSQWTGMEPKNVKREDAIALVSSVIGGMVDQGMTGADLGKVVLVLHKIFGLTNKDFEE